HPGGSNFHCRGEEDSVSESSLGQRSSRMSVTQDAAAEALRLADEAGQRSAMLRGYQSAAPHLILWGGVYAVAYTFGYFRPHQAGVAWAALIPIATIGDVLIAWRDRS